MPWQARACVQKSSAHHYQPHCNHVFSQSRNGRDGTSSISFRPNPSWAVWQVASSEKDSLCSHHHCPLSLSVQCQTLGNEGYTLRKEKCVPLLCDLESIHGCKHCRATHVRLPSASLQSSNSVTWGMKQKGSSSLGICHWSVTELIVHDFLQSRKEQQMANVVSAARRQTILLHETCT